MDYPFTVPGYEHIPLTLRAGLGTPTIFHQGVPLERIAKFGSLKYRLQLADNSELLLGIKSGGFELAPKVLHGDQVINIIPPLPAYGYVLVYLPLVLIFLGGAIGGFCGGLAAVLNAKLIRSSQHLAVKITCSLLITGAAVILWLVAREVFVAMIHHHSS